MASSLLSLLSLLVLSSLAAALSATAAGEPHQMELLAPVLVSLGYQELAMAVHSLLLTSPASTLAGPITLFAPSDDSLRSCSPPACSPLLLLREHLIPGLVSADFLSRLPFGAKLDTTAPGRCLTVTSTAIRGSNASSADKIFVNGVQITRPDLFNDGRIVIHGIQGFVAPLTPLSCVKTPDPASPAAAGTAADPAAALRDAAVKLHRTGYSILALAMRVKHAELAALNNMTVFAVDDFSIFTGGQAYVTNVRFHVVPDRLLVHADLMRLPEGTVLPTLVRGQRLVVTHGGGASGFPLLPGIGLRINYVPIRMPDVVYNTRIAVHGIYMPFPHLYSPDLAAAAGPDEGELFGSSGGDDHEVAACSVSASNGSGGECAAATAATPADSVAEYLMDDGGL